MRVGHRDRRPGKPSNRATESRASCFSPTTARAPVTVSLVSRSIASCAGRLRRSRLAAAALRAVSVPQDSAGKTPAFRAQYSARDIAGGENRDARSVQEIVAAGHWAHHFPSVEGESRGTSCASSWARGEAPSGAGEFSGGSGPFFTSVSFGPGGLGRYRSMPGTSSIKISRSARFGVDLPAQLLLTAHTRNS